MHRSSSVYKPKDSKTVLNYVGGDFDVRDQQEMDFFTVRSIILDYVLVMWGGLKNLNIIMMDYFLQTHSFSQDVN